MPENNSQGNPGLVERIRRFYNRMVKHDGQGILIPLFGIILIGFLNGYSVTYTKVLSGGHDWMPFLLSILKQLTFLAIGTVVAIIFYHFDYRKWTTAKWQFIMLATIVGLLFVVYTNAAGHDANGAQRWIGLPLGLTIQPSEFAKLGAIIWAAYTLDSHVKKHGEFYLLERYDWSQSEWIHNRWVRKIKSYFGKRANGKWGNKFKKLSLPKVFIPAVFIVPGIYSVMTLLQPDMGTAVIIFWFPVLMTLLVGYHKGHRKYLYGLMGLGVIAACLLIYFSTYRWKRIQAYYDPWSDITVNGYQVTQSILSAALGGFWGEGFTKGISKYNYLPEAHTDFAFSIFAQEFGFLGVLVVIALFLWFTKYALSIARHSRDFLGQILATGLTFFITGQAFFNMAMVAGLLPVTGVPLPFISYGGSSLVTNFAVIGILLNIARRNEYARKQIGTNRDLQSIGEETRHRFKPRS